MKAIIEFFYNLRFKHKLLLSFMLVALIPLIVWSSYSFALTNTMLRQQAGTGFSDLSSNIHSNMDSKFREVETTVSTIARDSAISQIITGNYVNNYQKYDDITRKLDPLTNVLSLLNPYIRQITLYTTGSIQDARISFQDLQTALDDPHLARAATTTDMCWFSYDNRLFVAQQTRSPEDIKLYAIVALEIDYYGIFNHAVLEDADGYGVIISDEAGQTVFRSDMGGNRPGLKTMDANQLRQLSQESGNLLFTSRALHPPGWTMALYMDIDTMLLSPRSAFGTTVVVTFLSLLLILVTTVFLSRTVVKPIAVLKTNMAGVVSSNFQTVISSEYKDEIGEITNTVGLMVQETRELIHEVYESRLQLRDAEIKALQSQINPHFLYNTLSAINWQAIKSDNMAIADIVTSLSTFYRTILNHGDNITTVRTELENTMAYLDVQLRTHNNGFDVVIDVDEGLYAYNMPNIILQPIVENAIEHGIFMMHNGQRGRIIIRGYERGESIIFEVIDNGEGMDEEKVQDILTNAKSGYGVKNVNHRLQLFFNKNYGLSFHQAKPRGTKVIIHIPKYIHRGGHPGTLAPL